jgi:hypothetical protein
MKMTKDICFNCEISKEEFCKEYKKENVCSHYRKESDKKIFGKIKSCDCNNSWYLDLVGTKISLVGKPTRYYGGLGYHVLGYIGKGVLVKDLIIEGEK